MGAWNRTHEAAADLLSMANMSADIAALKARSFFATHGGPEAANVTANLSRVSHTARQFLSTPRARALLMRLPGVTTAASLFTFTSALGTGLLAVGLPALFGVFLTLAVLFPLLGAIFVGPAILRALAMTDRQKGTTSAEAVRRRRLPTGPQAAPNATKAIDSKHREGTPGVVSERTVLQQHLEFFDVGGKGYLTPADTFRGFRRIGFSRAFSAASVVPLHTTFSFATWPDWRPRPSLPIFLDRAHRCKHGSDSGTFDSEGRFTPQRFAEIFSKYATAKDAKDAPALSFGDLQEMLHGNMVVGDCIGWLAARLEWWTLWLIAQDERGLLSQERVRATFDGSLWRQLEEVAIRRRGYDVAPRVAKGRVTGAGETGLAVGKEGVMEGKGREVRREVVKGAEAAKEE